MTIAYASTPITDRIMRISDGSDVCTYLVVGDKRALLVDTGYGFRGLRSYVESLLQGKPYDVVITHGHVDHAAGAAEFDTAYMHPADLELNVRHTTIEFRRAMLSTTSAELIADISDDAFVPTRSDFLPLEDRQTFNLGDLTVCLFHVPGHTQGMMVPVMLEERVALFGDACGVGTLIVFEEASTVTEYRESLLAFKQHEGLWDRVLRQHGTCESPKSILSTNIELCSLIMAREDDAFPAEFAGMKTLMAKAVDPVSRARIDGGEGNIMYIEEKIR